MTINFTKNTAYKALNIILLVAIIVLLAVGGINTTSGETRKITVTGEATIEAEPDEFTFSPYFRATGSDRDVLKETITKQANEAIDKLKELGVEEKDMKLDVSGYESWYYREGEKGVLTAYLEISIDDEDIVQDVQDYLYSIDVQGSITPSATFSESKKKEIDNQVTNLAIDDAKAQAELQAKKFDTKVGKVLEVKQDQNSVFQPYYGIAESAEATSVDSSKSTPVLVGQNEYTQQVTVTYELK